MFIHSGGAPFHIRHRTGCNYKYRDKCIFAGCIYGDQCHRCHPAADPLDGLLDYPDEPFPSDQDEEYCQGGCDDICTGRCDSHYPQQCDDHYAGYGNACIHGLQDRAGHGACPLKRGIPQSGIDIFCPPCTCSCIRRPYPKDRKEGPIDPYLQTLQTGSKLPCIHSCDVCIVFRRIIPFVTAYQILFLGCLANRDHKGISPSEPDSPSLWDR